MQLASPQLGGAAVDDGELHTRLPHPNIQLEYGLELVLGLGTTCVPVPNIVFHQYRPMSGQKLEMCNRSV